MTCIHRKQPFLVFTKSAPLVRHLQFNINPTKPNLRLGICNERANVNVTEIIQQQQIDAGIDMGEWGPMYLNTQVVLRVDKKNAAQRTYQKELAHHLSYHLHVATVSPRDVMLLPLVKDIGIVIPHSVEENEQ